MTLIQQTLITVVGSTLMLGVAIYFLSIFNRLFRRVNNIWLRKNLAVLLVGCCFMLSMVAVTTEIIMKAQQKGLVLALMTQVGHSIIIILFVFNFVWVIRQIPGVRTMSFMAHHAVIIGSIVVSAMFIYSTINFFSHGFAFKELRFVLVLAFYNALATGLIYTAVNYVDLERKRKLNEKEL